MDGIPGLSDLPVLGRMFTHSKTETTQSDIILTLTPHIVRVLDVDENDLRAFRVGRDSLSPVSEVPTPIDVRPPATVPPIQPAQPSTVQPIQPPPATPPQTPPPSPPPVVPPSVR